MLFLALSVTYHGHRLLVGERLRGQCWLIESIVVWWLRVLTNSRMIGGRGWLIVNLHWEGGNLLCRVERQGMEWNSLYRSWFHSTAIGNSLHRSWFHSTAIGPTGKESVQGHVMVMSFFKDFNTHLKI